MIKESVTLDEVLEVLNRIVKTDPQAAHDLVETRVGCNDALAKDPTIQVVEKGVPMLGTTKKLYSVGLLGVLNGIFGAHDDGWGAIQVTMEDDGTVVGFSLTKQAKEAFGR